MTVDTLRDRFAELHDRAVAATGLSDFGKDDYRTGLEVLLAAIEETPGLAEQQRSAVAGIALGPLVGRLHSEEGWRRRPDCLEDPIRRPVVITALPRTGTTLLHKLLSVGERFQVLESWLIGRPMVRPPREVWDSHPAYQEALARAAEVPQEIKATHFAEPHEAEECLASMAQSFVTNMFGSSLPVPGYDEWFFEQDMAPSFRRYANNLRLIGADDPGKTWLLKNPSYVLAMDALLGEFPDARVIQTHRRPLETMGSLCSLLCIVQRGRLGDSFDPMAITKREIKVWSTGMQRAQRVRDRHPEHFFDVDYRELVSEPIEVVRSVHDFLDLEMTPGTEATMRRWLAENPQTKHGVHSYRAEDFGLDRELILDHFADYIERYDL